MDRVNALLTMGNKSAKQVAYGVSPGVLPVQPRARWLARVNGSA